MVTNSSVSMTAGIGQIVIGNAIATLDPAKLSQISLSNGSLTASGLSAPQTLPILVYDGISSATNGSSGVAYGSTSAGIPAGSLALIFVRGVGASTNPVPTAFVDSAGNVYTQAIATSGATYRNLAIWYCPNCLALPAGGTITGTIAGGNKFWAQVGYAAGYATLDKTNYVDAASTTSSSLSVTPTTLNELVIALFATPNPSSFTESAAFTSITSSDNLTEGSDTAYAIASSAVNYNASWTPSQVYDAVMVSFIPIAEGGVLSTSGYSTGKWHFEITLNVTDTAGKIAFGFANASFPLSTKWLGQDNNSFGIQNTSPVKAYFNNILKFTASSGTMAPGDTIAIEVDFGGQLFWYQNITSGPFTWNANPAASPATGANGISFATLAAGPYYVAVMLW